MNFFMFDIFLQTILKALNIHTELQTGWNSNANILKELRLLGKMFASAWGFGVRLKANHQQKRSEVGWGARAIRCIPKTSGQCRVGGAPIRQKLGQQTAFTVPPPDPGSTPTDRWLAGWLTSSLTTSLGLKLGWDDPHSHIKHCGRPQLWMQFWIIAQFLINSELAPNCKSSHIHVPQTHAHPWNGLRGF